MTDIAVADPGSAQAPRELAARYGLRPAGELPTLRAYAAQLWAYRYFIAGYANARLIASFTSVRLGRIWSVLTPLTNVGVYYLIFGVVLNTRERIPNFIAYLCTGLFVFNFTQTVILAGTQAITLNLGLIRALHFPRACLPLSTTITHLQSLLASMLVLVSIVLITGEPLTVNWLLVVPALLLQSLFNAGLALTMARLGAKITDLKQLIPFIMRTWMYASGVLYNVDNFAKHLPKAVAEVMQVNPLLVYIELVRHGLLASAPQTSSPLRLWLLAIAWAVAACVIGIVYFWRGEQEYGRG